MANKPPAFMFYAKDWLTDLRTRAMTPAQKGHYIDLLATMWLEGGRLPKAEFGEEETILMSLTGATKEELYPIVECFNVIEDKGKFYYIQKRMQVEIEKQRENRIRKSEAAHVRWDKEKNKPEAPKTSRAERIAKAAKTFRDTLDAHYKKHPKKYSVEMYKEFFDYWGIPENKNNPERLVMEKQQSWNLARRLATWYARTDKGKTAPDVKISIDTTPINMDK